MVHGRRWSCYRVQVDRVIPGEFASWKLVDNQVVKLKPRATTGEPVVKSAPLAIGEVGHDAVLHVGALDLAKPRPAPLKGGANLIARHHVRIEGEHNVPTLEWDFIPIRQAGLVAHPVPDARQSHHGGNAVADGAVHLLGAFCDPELRVDVAYLLYGHGVDIEAGRAVFG